MLERSQMARQRALDPPFEGSNPSAPAIFLLNNFMADIKILTHIDFDGIFSGAIIYYELVALCQRPDIILATPKNLDKPFKELSSSITKIKSLYIADLSVNDNITNLIEPNLEILKKSGVEIYWYDHHQWTIKTIETVKKYCKELIVLTKYKTAAELLVKENIFTSEYSQKLVRAIKNQYIDDIEREWGEEWKYYLNSLSDNKIDFIKIENAIIKLSKNQKFNFFEKLKIKKVIKQRKVSDKFIENKHRIEETSHGRKFTVIDLREAKNINQMIAREITAKNNSDFYISVLDNNRLQIGIGANRTLDFRELFSLKKYKGYEYNIKGHSYVAAVYFTPSFISILKNIFSKKFNDETEAIIELMKERY